MLSPGILNTLLSHHCHCKISRHHFPLLTLSSLLSQRLGSDGPVILILVLSNLDQFQIQIKLILYRNVWYFKNTETLTIPRYSITAFGSLFQLGILKKSILYTAMAQKMVQMAKLWTAPPPQVPRWFEIGAD